MSCLSEDCQHFNILFAGFVCQTMYRMVEDVTVQVNGNSMKKKFLYLTNAQAAMLNRETIGKCIQALDIGEPKCVIRLP